MRMRDSTVQLDSAPVVEAVMYAMSKAMGGADLMMPRLSPERFFSSTPTAGMKPESQPKVYVRKEFPETWIFTNLISWVF
uniref:Uncharacterized protein n=1 Tax=Panagrolaimus davidi TaxID=227884 RepID=A0A914P0N7_9BILA